MRTEHEELEIIRGNLKQAVHSVNAVLHMLEMFEARLNAKEPEPPKITAVEKIEIEKIEKIVSLVVKEPEPVKKVITPEPKEELIINEEWKRVLDLMNHGTESLFITGEAGTGKSTLLEYFKSHSRGTGAVIAPTGVAALRVGGQTIHRFFGFGAHAQEKKDIKKLSEEKRKKYEKLVWLLIDEISMVRADVMDAIDLFLRLNGPNPLLPFGGVRILMFGDLFQLPPVAKHKDEKKWLEVRYGTDTPYFFHAECWRTVQPKICELTTIFRQKDPIFTGALNAIRKGETHSGHINLINSRVNVLFSPPKDELWLTLTTTNAKADEANQKMLRDLTTASKVFQAVVSADFNVDNAPTDVMLELKVGAIVMFIRNDASRRWVNGTMGKVTSVAPLTVEVDDMPYEIVEEEWQQRGYEYDEEKDTLVSTITGTFTQIPLRLAAAITIHKSQGLSLDRVVIDMGSGAFAAGQAYVALSRCRTLSGMVLRTPVRTDDLLVSTEVQKFMKGELIARPAGQRTLFESVSVSP